MTDAQLYKELSALPDSLKQEVAKFIAHLKQKISLEKKSKKALDIVKEEITIHNNSDNPVSEPSATKKKLSDLAGKLSHETADAMQKYVLESRNDWEERLKKQF